MDGEAADNTSYRASALYDESSSNRPITFAAEHGTVTATRRRAVAACTRVSLLFGARNTSLTIRCRGHKVRCTGGDPCDRCLKSRSTCQRGPNPQRSSVTRNRRRTSSEQGSHLDQEGRDGSGARRRPAHARPKRSPHGVRAHYSPGPVPSLAQRIGKTALPR
jgi:hypothetical protein